MIKVRMQLAGQSPGGAAASPLGIARQMIAEGGITSLYKGLDAGLTRQLTYGMSRLGLFRTISQKFTPEGGTAADIPFMTMLGISLTAGGTAALIGTPADAALVRMQADTTLPVEQRRNYKWVGDALVRMAREEGLKGFFAGGTPTICRGLAINVGMFTTRDKFKQFNQNVLGMQPDGAPNRFFSGFLSGWVAATATLPFDFIKTRLQKQKPDANGKLQYNGVLDCAQKVLRSEGPMAFYAGYGTFVVRICPHIMLTWVFMDAIDDVLKGKGL
jgi:solute carrier family 25 oxoglutarate transporter 11